MRMRNVISAAVLGAVAGLMAEGYYAGHRPLPSFENLDPSGSLGRPMAPEVSIVTLGDSTVTGPGLLGPEETWLHQVAGALTDDVRIRITNVAVGGSKGVDVRREQLAPALDSMPDIAVVSVGSNDAIRGVPVAIFRSELRVIVDALTQAGAIVALPGVGDLSTIPRLAAPLTHLLRVRSAAFDRVHSEVARGRPNVVKVPIRDLATHAFRTQPGMFSPDLFHPSREGHAAWASAAMPSLSRMIRFVVERKQPCAD